VAVTVGTCNAGNSRVGVATSRIGEIVVPAPAARVAATGTT